MQAFREWPHVWGPSAAGSTAPALLALHGTGGDEYQFMMLTDPLQWRFHYLAPRGLSRDEGINRWFRRLREGVFDLADLQERATELAEFVRQAAAHYRFDPTQLRAVGYSNGANILGAMLLTGQLRPVAAALLHPMVPFVPERMPSLAGVRLLLTQGEADPTMPPNHAADVEQLYRGTGASIETFAHQNGHSLTPDEFATVVRWLEAS